MTDECKCSVFRETVQGVIDFVRSCKPHKPNSLLAKAWGNRVWAGGP